MSLEKKIPFAIYLQSVLMAFLIDIPVVNLYFTNGYLDDSSGMMATLYAITIIIIFFTSFFVKKHNNNVKLGKQVAYIVVLCLFYLLTMLIQGMPEVQFVYFGVYVICSILIPALVWIDVSTVLKWIMVFSVPAIFWIDSIFAFESLYIDSISMGTSFAFLAPVIVALVYLFKCFKHESFVSIIISIILISINFIFALQLIMFGSRGPILAMSATVGFLYVTTYNKEKRCLHIQKSRFIITAAIFAGVFIVLIPMLNAVQNYTASQDLSLHFVDKSLQMNEDGDISNGREAISAIALDGILDSPIYGHGLDRFFANTGIIYPHNFITQLLYDGGIVLFLFFVIPLFMKIRKLFLHSSIEECTLIIALFFCSVPCALFSGNLWENNLLWLLFGVALTDDIAYNNLNKI